MIRDLATPEFRYDDGGGFTRWFPTEEYKHSLMLALCSKYNLSTFVETGTCEGHGVNFAKRHFERVYSIELGDYYYNRAVELFKDDINVTLIHGDSGKELRALLPKIGADRTLFYLDAHFSGGLTVKSPNYSGSWAAPLREEMRAIFEGLVPGVILIDDLQEFWTDGLPEAVIETAKAYPEWQLEIEAGLGLLIKK